MRYIITTVFCAVIGLAAAFASRPAPKPVEPLPVIPDLPTPSCPVTKEPCDCGCTESEQCVCGFGSWEQDGRDVETRKQNVVVFVNTRPRAVSQLVTLTAKTFPDVKGSGIVVGVWRDGVFLRHDLPATATNEQIRDLLTKPVASAPTGTSRPVAVHSPAATGSSVMCRGGR